MVDVGYRYAYATGFIAAHMDEGFEEDPDEGYLLVHDDEMAQHDIDERAAALDPSLGEFPLDEDGFVDEDQLRSDGDGR